MKPDPETQAEGEAQGESTETKTEATNTIEGGAGNDDLEHPAEGLADHPDDVRSEELAEAALERAEGPKHGTHNAAMAGLQTDASGSKPPTFPRGDGYE